MPTKTGGDRPRGQFAMRTSDVPSDTMLKRGNPKSAKPARNRVRVVPAAHSKQRGKR